MAIIYRFRKRKKTVIDICKTLLKDYNGRFHILYMDRFYNSPKLCNDLLKAKTYVCGTIKSNRIGPKNTKEIMKNIFKILKKRESEFYSTGNLQLCLWKDKRNVLIISNFMDNKIVKKTEMKKNSISNIFEPVENDIPNVIDKYINYMNWVDLFDQMSNYYKFEHKSSVGR